MSIIASVFIATSLDGFIARANGDLDWLDRANASIPDGEDCGYGAFMAAIDTLVMGRKTYEKVLSFPQWPYEDKPVIVLSRSNLTIPEELAGTVTHSAESPQEICDRLSKAGVKRLYIDGGFTIQRFLAEKLIDDLTITIIPVILGAGIALFPKLESEISLKHINTKIYPFGFVQLSYRVQSEK